MRPTVFLIAVFSALVLPAAASAGEVKVAGGILTYVDAAPNAKNVVGIAVTSSAITVREAGTTTSGSRIRMTGDGSCAVGRSGATCPRTGVTAIQVAVGPQNDAVAVSGALPASIAGADGNDNLTGGGADDVLVGGPGADTLKGGAGNDRADYSERIAPLSVSADDKPGDGEVGENDNVGADVEYLNGGAAGDTLVGNDAANALEGGGGDDVLDGRGGADLLQGGDGIDTASYASHAGVRVTLDGKPGDGAPGENDSVNTERVIGSPGDDVLIGGPAADVLVGGDGNDRLLGGAGADALDGGAGDDIIQSLDGQVDTVACGGGEDGVVSDRRDVRTDCDYIKYRVLAATSTAVHPSRGTVRIPVRCSPATAEGCTGRAALKVGSRTIGTRTFRLKPGRRWVARIRLNKRGRTLTKRSGVLTTSLVVRDRDGAGVSTTTRQTIRVGD